MKTIAREKSRTTNRFACQNCREAAKFVVLSCEIQEEEIPGGGGFRLHFLPDDARSNCATCAMKMVEELGLYVVVLPDGTRRNVCRNMEGLRNLPPQRTVLAMPADARLVACWCERTQRELIFVELDAELRLRIERAADVLSGPSGDLCMRRVADFLKDHPDLHPD